jgi:putative PIN family toxin of toxin-antitoxin system
MARHRIVLDTNVLVAALRSSKGASHKLLLELGGANVDFCISVALALEYEAVVKRPASGSRLTNAEKDDVLDYLCAESVRQKIYFLWRPTLKDPADDMVLEVAVASGAEAIVTFNKKDFGAAGTFGVKVLSPKEFLSSLRGKL